jgi:thymidylate kinase
MVAEFLSSLFNNLNVNRISYCILRSYDELPYKVGNDLDIWVNKSDLLNFWKILSEIATKYGWYIIKPNVSPRLNKYVEGKYYLVKKSPPHIVLHIDCWTYLYWKGICFIDAQIISNFLQLNNNQIYCPSKQLEAGLLLIGDLLWKGKIPQSHREKIKDCLDNKICFDYSPFKRSIGSKTLNTIFKYAQLSMWEDLEKASSLLKIKLIIRSIIYCPVKTLKNLVIYLWKGFENYFIKKYGIFLVLIGPDGTGKTTIAKALLNSDVAEKLFYKKFYFHTNFPILPRMRKIAQALKLIKKENNEIPSLRRIEPLPFFKSLLYPIYYGFNYFLGHFWLWKQKANGGSLVIFDRYFYEYFIQPSFKKCPRWLLKIIIKIIPNPDILIFIKSEPEQIYLRKQELSLEEINRQIKICEEIISQDKNGVVIENINIEKTVEQIQKLIIEKLKL